MYVWIGCPQFHEIGVWATHVSSSKIPKWDLGSRVLKMGVNLHEIVRIRLDDTSKQGLMHELVGKRAKMKRSKGSLMGGTKQA